MFVWFNCSECVCRHTQPCLKHTQTGGMGWLALSHSPTLCWFWSVSRDFFSTFPFLTFQCENFESKLRLSSCSLETRRPILNYKLFSPSRFNSALVWEKEHSRSSSHLLRSRSAKKPQRWTAQSSGRSCCPTTTSCLPNLKDMRSQLHMLYTPTHGQ